MPAPAPAPANALAGAGRLGPLAVTALAAIFAFRRIDDFDTWWHLAAGRWIALHHSVPATDVLSHTVRGHAWINLEWLYEVVLYALHAAGGPVLLSLAAAAGFTASVWLLLRLLRAPLGDIGAAMLGFAAVVVMQDRFAVRPEMVSFPLLAGLLTILDTARRRDGHGLFWLVPLMVVWVNVHPLFVIGVFAILCELAGRPSRRLAGWGLAAIAAVLVNPFGLSGVMLPAKLFTLIDKASPAFQTIAEFRSPFAPDVGGIAIAFYKVLLVAGSAVVLAAAAASVGRRAESRSEIRTRPDLGGIAFFAGLAALSIVARRNAALFALGASPLRLMEQNPTLMRLREIEALERVADKGRLSVVVGEGGLAGRVVKLV